MRTYWIECETIYAVVLVSNDMQESRQLKCFEDYECLPNSRVYLKKAWKHAEKLAKQYAKRHNMKALYTTHPNRTARACWLVM